MMQYPDAVYVEDKIAMVYYQPIPKMIEVHNRKYIFDCRFGVAMIFVSEMEVAPLLNFKGGCCGGQRQVVFLANQAQYSHWLNGKGGR